MDKRINIDGIRFLCTLFVVAIHVYPFTFLSEDIDYMITRVFFRIAVPFFLMITGYYLLPKALEKKGNLITYTKKIGILYFISILIYLPLMFYNGYFKGISMLSFMQDIFINGTFYHLWYFPALLLGVWITYFLLKIGKTKQVVFLVFILYLIGIFGDSYYGIISNIPILESFYDVIFKFSSYTRNGVFYVPIFLVIGYLVEKNKNIKNRHLLPILISCLGLLFEGGILYFYGIPRHSSMYFFLLPFSFYTFSCVIENGSGANTNLRTLCSWVYILHPFFITLVHFMTKKIFILTHSFVNYSVVLFLTIAFIFILRKIKEVVIHDRK